MGSIEIEGKQQQVKLRKPYPGYSRILAVVDAQIGSKLKKQLCAHWGITMATSHEADLRFGWFRYLWVVGDLQGPDGSKLHTLTKARQNKTKSLGS